MPEKPAACETQNEHKRCRMGTFDMMWVERGFIKCRYASCTGFDLYSLQLYFSWMKLETVMGALTGDAVLSKELLIGMLEITQMESVSSECSCRFWGFTNVKI